jgi:hypothetical protein
MAPGLGQAPGQLEMEQEALKGLARRRRNNWGTQTRRQNKVKVTRRVRETPHSFRTRSRAAW